MRKVGKTDFQFTLRSLLCSSVLPLCSGCAVFEGLLINKIHRPLFLFLIGQVESLPHSGAGDAPSSRILHVRLFLFLIESLAVGQREKAGFATSRVSDGPGALDTKHFPFRGESGAQEQVFSGCLSLFLAFPVRFSSLSLSLPHTHTHSRPRTCTLCIRLHFAVVNYGIDLNGKSGSVSCARPFFDGPTSRNARKK